MHNIYYLGLSGEPSLPFGLLVFISHFGLRASAITMPEIVEINLVSDDDNSNEICLNVTAIFLATK